MLALPEIQACVMDALLWRSDGVAAAALLRSTTVPSPQQRLQIYRNNLFANLLSALQAVYPVIERLVGANFFRQVAKAYIRAHPSRSGNVQDFGGALPQYLRTCPAADMPYLTDVAALEWAYHQAYHVQELVPMGLDRLAQVPQDGQGQVCLRLQPGAHLIASRYPVLKIWQMNQPEVVDSGATLSLDEGGVQLMVVQHALEIEFRLLGAAEYQWLHALAGGDCLADATQKVLDGNPTFDLAGTLARHFGLGAFVGISVPHLSGQEAV